VLFKGGAHLEQLAGLKAIAFDKTGTLTRGRPQLTDLHAANDISENELLALAAGAESLSEHPLAKAVTEAARARGLRIPAAEGLQAVVGHGVRAKVGGREVWVGRPALFTEQGWEIPPDVAERAGRLAETGKTVALVGAGSEVLGLLAIADSLRPGSAEALHSLSAMGIEHLVMLTGDNRTVAETIARSLDMEFEAELMPEDKLRVIQRLRSRYDAVGMVGDGINDAPSLAAASLGISLGGAGTDVALETADVVLMADDLGHLPYAVALARQANRIIRQNLVFALGVMVVLLAFTYFGSLRLPLGVVGHEGSTVLVIFNGLRLLRFPRPGGAPSTETTPSFP
jgi:Cd2+/Zn2+-exporting ATPase